MRVDDEPPEILLEDPRPLLYHGRQDVSDEVGAEAVLQQAPLGAIDGTIARACYVHVHAHPHTHTHNGHTHTHT